MRVRAPPANSVLPLEGTTTVVTAATTNANGSVKTTISCYIPRLRGGDLGYRSYWIAADGSVTITTKGYEGVWVRITEQAWPKAGVDLNRSQKWTREWRVS